MTTLLSHYWTADEPAELRALQMGDWLEDLGEFSAAVVASACQEWRRTSDKRPTIAGLRKICLDSRPATARSLPSYDPIAIERSHAVTALKYREAAESREIWAREHGCQSFKDAMQIGLVIVGRRLP